MEYAACGIPCIATPTESYRHWVEEGVNGFLAKGEKDWIQRLDELVVDEELRTRMGVAARAKAKDNTIQAHWAEWERVYEQILGVHSHAHAAGSPVAA
jgi:glycosyltransferase involved in cell wall biosynthesis